MNKNAKAVPEGGVMVGKPPSPNGDQPSSDEGALKRGLLKLDLFLLPMVTIIYFLNFLDRSNIGNAKAAGLQTDLKLTNTEYSTALTVTYVPYIVAELPLTLAMRIVGPHFLLPTLVVCWGLVTTFQGFVWSYSGLLAARFFLGLTEGAILPASIAYMSTFYTRAALGKRVAIFFSATSLAGAFSGLLAAALLNMNGLGGKAGWQWIFIIEGLLTVVCGAIAYFVLARDPETARYLKEDERLAIVGAQEIDRQNQPDHGPINLPDILSAFTAPQMWFVFCQFFSSGVMLYALAYFTPTIVGSIGYKGTSIQLHSVPPYACSAFVAVLSCWFSDSLKHRGAFVVAASLISLAGYIMYLKSTDTHVLYASLFLQIIGAYTVAPLQSTWMANNLAPFYKRVTGISMGFICTNSGGILSTWLFPTTEAPRYHRAVSILLGLTCSQLFFAVLNSLYLIRENRKRDRLEARGDSDQGKGDRNVRFRYIT